MSRVFKEKDVVSALEHHLSACENKIKIARANAQKWQAELEREELVMQTLLSLGQTLHGKPEQAQQETAPRPRIHDTKARDARAKQLRDGAVRAIRTAGKGLSKLEIFNFLLEERKLKKLLISDLTYALKILRRDQVVKSEGPYSSMTYSLVQ